jgi:diguanylate cyclase (GGDEF)-like protein/PAS domain S-box-containing protein
MDADDRGDAAALLALMEVVTDVLRRFAEAPAVALDERIDEALRRIGELTGVDRSYLFVLGAVPGTWTNSHEWCAEGIAPEIDNLGEVPIDTVAAWLEPFAAGQPVYIPRVGALPDDRAEERDLLAEQGIQSLVTVPLANGGRLLGFLGFDSVRAERRWSPEALFLLRAVADVIVGGLVRREALAALTRSEERFRALVRHSSDLVVVIDGDGCIAYLGPSAERILGWDPGERTGARLADVVHPDDLAGVSTALAAAAAHGADLRLPDHRLRHADGTWRWMLSTAVDLSADPAIAGIVVNSHDITVRKRAEDALRHQAVHDPLTGLPNRSLLMARLGTALARPREAGGAPVLVFLDVDRFKIVNDSLGHQVGDALLVEVGRRLQGAVGAIDTVARFGGDEFLVLLAAPHDAPGAFRAAARLRTVLDEPVNVGGRELHLTASAGVVLVEADRRVEGAPALVRDADAALYQAKERGRARTALFDPGMQSSMLDRLDVGHDLRSARERGELHVHYQPLFSLRDGAIVGTEALLRWEHPVRGAVSPATFIPLAEETGLIAPLGAWVLDAALDQLRRWDLGFPLHPQLRMSVNLSVRQLADGDLVGTVATLLDRHGVAPARLCLELTESALMAEPDRGRAVLGELRDLGVRLAIDDFGTGYSSFAYLRDLPVTTLKIDRSFMTGLGAGGRDARVVAAIVGLAHELGLTAVAEGVETVEQLHALTALGCDVAQGFYLLRPAPAEALTELRRAMRPEAAAIRVRRLHRAG